MGIEVCHVTSVIQLVPNDLPLLFQRMFPDSSIAEKFYIGHDKVRYMILYGLASHSHDSLKTSLLASQTQYSLSFDESLNESLQLGQMDIHVLHWDEGISAHHSWDVLQRKICTKLFAMPCKDFILKTSSSYRWMAPG